MVHEDASFVETDDVATEELIITDGTDWKIFFVFLKTTPQEKTDEVALIHSLSKLRGSPVKSASLKNQAVCCGGVHASMNSAMIVYPRW